MHIHINYLSIFINTTSNLISASWHVFRIVIFCCFAFVLEGGSSGLFNSHGGQSCTGGERDCNDCPATQRKTKEILVEVCGGRYGHAIDAQEGDALDRVRWKQVIGRQTSGTEKT